MFPPRRFVPEPLLPPSPAAVQALRVIREIVGGQTGSEASVQTVVDLLHIHRAAYEAVDPALYVAVRRTRSVSFGRMAEIMGMSRGAIQLRVDNGDPAKPSRTDKSRRYRRQIAERDTACGPQERGQA